MDLKQGVELDGDPTPEFGQQIVAVGVIRQHHKDNEMLRPFASGLHRNRRRLRHAGVVVDDTFEFERLDFDPTEVHGVVGPALGAVEPTRESGQLVAVAAEDFA